MKGYSLRNRGAVACAALIAASLVTGVCAPGSAHAEIGYCRTDPVLAFTDGRMMDLTTAVAATPSDVKQIAYTIHVPATESVAAVYVTPGPLSHKETWRVVTDGGANSYTMDTLVTTASGSNAVTVTAVVVDPAAGTLATGSVSGSAGQTLAMTLSPSS